jgi:hypothetical protein
MNVGQTKLVKPLRINLVVRALVSSLAPRPSFENGMRKPEWQHEGSMDQARRRATIDALQQCDQNVAKAAKRLHISRSTMYRLAKFELRVVEDGMENVPRERHPGRVKGGQDGSSDAWPRHQGKLVQVDDQLFLVS